MKRLNNLFPKIKNIDNIELADNKARKGKEHSYGVRKHDQNNFENIMNLYLDLSNGDYRTSKYTTFKIYEPKERVIFRLPYYPDRIVHHAIMNIMEPIWTKIFTKDTYACIKNRGIHALVRTISKNLKNDINGTKYCLKLDIRKFYPSIDHEILKEILQKKIKDKELLKLLFEIVDSAEGVPIGNYLSLFFANLYLAYFDHWIKEELKVKYYYRYADDIVLLSDNKNLLRNWFLAMKIYLTNVLKLKVKDNYLIYPVESRGIDFVGYVFYHDHILLRKSIKLKINKLLKLYKGHLISRLKLIKSLSSYFGWLKYCNSKHLLQKIYRETGLKYSGWNGTKTSLNKFINKYIHIVNVETRNKYFIILFLYNGQPYEAKCFNRDLYTYLVFFNNLPLTIKLCSQQQKSNQT